MKKFTFLVCFLIVSTLATAQTKTKYFYIDAVSDSTAQSGKVSKMYFYSYPIHYAEQVNEKALLDKFKEFVKTNHGVTKFSSCVFRTNDSYDEVKTTRDRTIDKYMERGYQILEVSGIY